MTRNYSEEDSVKKGLASLAVALGASAGDVAQIDANGNVTLAPGNGGSMPALARNVNQVAYNFSQSVARGTQANLTLSLNDGDTGMVDLGDPTYPNVIAAGLYAFTLVAVQTVGGLDQLFTVGLLVDDNYYSVLANPAGPVAAGWTSVTAQVTWWCDAADPFAVKALVENAGAGDPTFSGTVFVQRIR